MVPSDGASAESAGGRVAVDIDADAIHVRQATGVENIFRGAVGDNNASAEEDEAVRDGCCLVKVVQHNTDRRAVNVRKVTDQVKQFHLVPQVEVRGRLIEQEDAGLLREAAC